MDKGVVGDAVGGVFSDVVGGDDVVGVTNGDVTTSDDVVGLGTMLDDVPMTLGLVFITADVSNDVKGVTVQNTEDASGRAAEDVSKTPSVVDASTGKLSVNEDVPAAINPPSVDEAIITGELKMAVLKVSGCEAPRVEIGTEGSC